MLRVIDIIYFYKIITFISISPLFLLVLFALDSVWSDANIPALFCYHLLSIFPPSVHIQNVLVI